MLNNICNTVGLDCTDNSSISSSICVSLVSCTLIWGQVSDSYCNFFSEVWLSSVIYWVVGVHLDFKLWPTALEQMPNTALQTIFIWLLTCKYKSQINMNNPKILVSGYVLLHGFNKILPLLFWSFISPTSVFSENKKHVHARIFCSCAVLQIMLYFSQFYLFTQSYFLTYCWDTYHTDFYVLYVYFLLLKFVGYFIYLFIHSFLCCYYIQWHINQYLKLNIFSFFSLTVTLSIFSYRLILL